MMMNVYGPDSSSISNEFENQILMFNLPYRVTEYAVLKLLKPFGKIKRFSFPVHRGGKLVGSSLGYCFVTFECNSSVSQAISALDGRKFHDRVLSVKVASDNQKPMDYPADNISSKLLTSVKQTEPVFMCHFKEKETLADESKKQQNITEAIRKIEMALRKNDAPSPESVFTTKLLSGANLKHTSANPYLLRINHKKQAEKKRLNGSGRRLNRL